MILYKVYAFFFNSQKTLKLFFQTTLYYCSLYMNDLLDGSLSTLWIFLDQFEIQDGYLCNHGTHRSIQEIYKNLIKNSSHLNSTWMNFQACNLMYKVKKTDLNSWFTLWWYQYLLHVYIFNPATFLCLSQARNGISKVICHNLFLCSMSFDVSWLLVLLILVELLTITV